MLGQIVCEELVLRSGSGTVRPLADLFGLKPGGLTRLLERALVDFGAEESFARASERLYTHHRVSLSEATVRRRTLEHARAMRTARDDAAFSGALPAEGPERIVVEIDGTMLPVVDTETSEDGNARKHRSCQWKETRLAAAQAHGKTRSHYALGGADVAECGQAWAEAAALAGWALNSHIHALGDGATWIYRQYLQVFGSSPGRFLLDFFHVCEYLAAAGSGGASTHPRWLQVQKRRLLDGRPDRVLAALEPFLESNETADEDAPVRSAHRYLSARRNQLDYAAAVQNELPIGSGLIEGGHRHVLQKRLKISGAWWKHDNLTDMAHLRVCRANQAEDQYWKKLRDAA